MKYRVNRPHQGDKWYAEGDEREASAQEVAHLVEAGVLSAVKVKDERRSLNKAEKPVRNKAASK